MRLPELAIKSHQFTLVVVLMLSLLGIVSYATMPRSEDPMTDFAASSVIAAYPGINPTDLERMVADPIEEAINELEDVKDLSTEIRDGVVTTVVQFTTGSDPDDKYNKVLEAVTAVADELPANPALLEVMKHNVASVAILQFALVSETMPYREMQRAAERLERRLERVAGVREATSWAFPVQRVDVDVDPERLGEWGLSLNRLIGAIQSSAANIPGGAVNAGSRRFNLVTSGDYESIEDIRRTVVHSAGGRIVYLSDVADVEAGYAEDSYRARINGERCVFVTVVQRPGTNIFDVTRDVRQAVAEFRPRLPDGLRLDTGFDQSLSVEYRVNGFFLNLLQGLVLVGIVIFLALGLRASMVVMTVIPLSIFLALGWIDLADFGLQQMSIAGLVIALGLLVDNAIVVVQNISRFLKEGMEPTAAAVKGTSQIGWAIVSSTVTTVLAFLPMLLLQTETGEFIRSMPAAVCFALFASLLLSLTFTPYLAARFLRAPAPGTVADGGPIKGLLESQVTGPYRRAIGFALRHPALILTAATVLFAASVSLFPLVGVSLFPKAEKAQFIVHVDTPEGSSLDATDRIARRVESVLAGRTEIVRYMSSVGRGNPRIYYNLIPRREAPTHAEILVEMNANDENSRTALVTALRAELGGFAGARVEVREFEQGPPVQAPVAIRLFGEQLDVLRNLAGRVEQVIRATPGSVNVNNDSGRLKTDLHVNINRDKAGMLGIPLIDIDRAVRATVAGIPVASYRDEQGEDRDIVVRLPVADTPTIGDLDRIAVTAVTGARIPLPQTATLEFRTGPNFIQHYDLERVATVTSDVLPGYNIAEVTQAVIDGVAGLRLPEGYRLSVGGEQETRAESFGGMGQALILALLGIFSVLVLQFRSFRQPMIVFVAIPFAITGAILALLATGYTFSFTAFVGLTSLVGIVVNNSIILVDYANQLRMEGRSVDAAVREAGETRFTPIVLTTLTTVGALLPLTLMGGTLWGPFGWAIIGGLLLSTVLTLVIVPVLYKVLTPDECCEA